MEGGGEVPARDVRKFGRWARTQQHHELKPSREKGMQEANKGRSEERCLRRAAKGRAARGGEAPGGRAAGRLKASRRERALSRCYGRVGRGREIKCESGRGEGEDGLTREEEGWGEGPGGGWRGGGNGPWLYGGQWSGTKNNLLKW